MNTLHLTAENPDELLAGFGVGARIKIQSSATEDGAYADVTTVPLVAETRSYLYNHQNGISSTWYRTRFEDATGANANDYGPVFQVGDEQAGLLVSLYDAKQMLQQHAPGATDQDENIIEWIRQASDYITLVTGRQFAPDPRSGTKTIQLHTSAGYRLRVPRGVRSVTTLGIASSDQPAAGGVYTASTDFDLEPSEFSREAGWPATWIVMRPTSAGFNTAAYGVQITGAFGWSETPGDIRAVALNLVMAAAREGGASGGDTLTIGIGGERTYERSLSMKDWKTLRYYRTPKVG